MNESVEAAYDRLPYPSGPHPYSHPGHVGMLAKLAGIESAPLDQCRVLEIGGSDGGNLLPIAIDFPDSEFVCLDISRVQIEMGRRHAKSLDVENMQWHVADISQFDFSALGQFDYVIAHGVYSWVGRAVQDRLLQIFAERLSASGIGFISYNTYPGWHAHMALREMMLTHVSGIEDGDQRVDAVLDLVHQLAASTRDSETPIASVVRSFINSMNDFESVPVYITHEFLSHDNSPEYFHEFARRAEAVGLQVFGDGNHQEKSLELLPDEQLSWIEQQSSDPVMRNQYLDYLNLSAFRRSLLCRGDVAFDWDFKPTKWEELYVSANVGPVDDSNERWRTAHGNTFSTTHVLAQAILAKLSAAWPTSVKVADVAKSCGVTVEPIAQIVQSMFERDVVEARLAPQRCISVVADRPTASRFSRHQAAGGYVTTQRHGRIRLDDDLAKRLLPLLDGSRTIGQLADAMQISADDTTTHLHKMAIHGLLVP